MKRVNLDQYFKLAITLNEIIRVTKKEKAKGSELFFAFLHAPEQLKDFCDQDHGFSACKQVALEVRNEISSWLASNFDSNKENDEDTFTNRMKKIHESWRHHQIPDKVSSFISVFEAECREINVYSAEQVSIYKTSALVSKASDIIHKEYQKEITPEAIEEFNSAGRCLAFELSTACGFHALRGLELVMDTYLTSFKIDTSDLKSWHDYIVAAKTLTDKSEENDEKNKKKEIIKKTI